MGAVLRARRQPLIQRILDDPQSLRMLSRLHDGPLHIIAPQVFQENLRRMRAVFAAHGIDGNIAYAHKANKSVAFARAARAAGARIDVASHDELTNALAAGFTGSHISCTGPKNKKFVQAAALHGCLLSIDSLAELQLILEIGIPARVLVRVSDLQTRDRNVTRKLSRFGVSREELAKVYAMLPGTQVTLAGFHFHVYESVEVKAGMVNDLLSMVEEAYGEGFAPTIVNLGGGFREPWLEDSNQWNLFIDEMSSALAEKRPTGTWRDHAYGLFVNAQGTVSGRDRALGEFATQGTAESLDDLLTETGPDERPLAEVIAENLFTAMIEPGIAAFDQCGISVVRVIGTKSASNGEQLVVVDANTYNLSTGMQELVVDPELVSEHPGSGLFTAYIAGNLCKEGDVLVKRAITFASEPQPGDLLVFHNTAGYSSDFEDTAALGQPTGTKVVAVDQGDQIIYLHEEQYLP